MFPNLATHLKEKGNLWVVCLIALTGVAYFANAIWTRQSDQQMISNLASALFAATSLFGGCIGFAVCVSRDHKKDDDLTQFLVWIGVALLISIAFGALKLLALFGLR